MHLRRLVEEIAAGAGRRGSAAPGRVGCEHGECSSHRAAVRPQFGQGGSREGGCRHAVPMVERRASEVGRWGEGEWFGCQWRHPG